MTDRAAVAAAVAELERALRGLGWWQEAPPAPERMNFQAAFGADTLAFQEWLQWVLVPRVREGLAAGSLPHRSEVASYAVRELDGAPDADEVIQALMDLDDAING
jgi:uncharacterized protein YqcC (DUF446 family)